MCNPPVLRTPPGGEDISLRGSIEIQHRRDLTTVGLDLESLFYAFSSTRSPNGKTHCAEMNSHLGFESELENSGPPDGLQVTPNDEPSDTPLSLLDDPIQTSFIHNFLSELRPPSPVEPHPSPAPELECDPSDFSSTPSPAPSSVVTFGSSSGSTPAPLECTPANSFADPMDDPFLSNFTDISLLMMQDENPLLSTGGLNVEALQASPATSGGGGGVVEASPLTPGGSEVDITVVRSSSNVVDNCSQVLDLSDCVNFLTSCSSADAPFLSDTQQQNVPPTVVSTAMSVSSPSPSPPPPSTPLSATTSPSVTPSQTSSLLVDIDFTAISQQDIISLVTKFASSATQSPSYSSSNNSQPTETTTNTQGGSRKRKSSQTLEQPAAKVPRVTAEVLPAATKVEVVVLEDDKRKMRRDRNNKASQVSRAKRKQRRKDMEVRAEELEEENGRLRVRVETITTEIERLKKLLVDRLTQ